jgi:hypothetical protein
MAVKASVVLSGLCLSLAASATAQMTPVSLDCTTENGDTIGMRVCTELRDEIARSPHYREISSNTEDIHWGLHIVSTATDESKLVSAESVTITEGAYLQYFIEGYVLVTSQDRVNHQAQTILAALDEQVTAFANKR